MRDYQDAQRKLEGAEDVAYADFSAGLLDELSYRRRIKAVRAERLHFEALLAQANAQVSDVDL